MSRWIEEKWLNKRIKDSYRERIGLDSAPSIDIVRCKECENWQTDWVPEGCEGVEDLHYCAVVDGCKFGDFFCADGEREGE